MLRGFAFVALALLPACSPEVVANTPIVREGAAKVVGQTLFTLYPSVDSDNVEPYTDCIINGATAPEILKLAEASVKGSDEDTGTIIFDIIKRPDTALCFARAGFSGSPSF